MEIADEKMVKKTQESIKNVEKLYSDAEINIYTITQNLFLLKSAAAVTKIVLPSVVSVSSFLIFHKKRGPGISLALSIVVYVISSIATDMYFSLMADKDCIERMPGGKTIALKNYEKYYEFDCKLLEIDESWRIKRWFVDFHNYVKTYYINQLPDSHK